MKKWIFPVLSTITATIVSIITYARLPEEMAIHFGLSGTPNDWMSRPLAAFALPVLTILISLLIWFSLKLEKNENKRRRSEASIGSTLAILSTMLLAVHIFIIAYNLGYDLDVYTVATMIVGVLFILLGNLLPRLPQSSMNYPKLSESVWRKVSRFQGKTMMIFGVVFVLLPLLPSSYIPPIFFTLIIMYTIFAIGNLVRHTR